MSMSGKDNVLIVGGTGFIGRSLTAKCMLSTRSVTCMGLSEQGRRHCAEELEHLRVDITDREALRQALRNRKFDYVFNLGGYIDHSPYLKGGRSIIESHFTGLMNIIECLDWESLKGFVQVGSSDEYGKNISPQREDMRELPISPYSAAKVAATHLVSMLAMTEKFPGVVIRLFLVYGPGQDDRRFIPQIIKACLKNEPFKTSQGIQLRDFCFVDDVVEGMIKAALSPSVKGKILNIASGKPVTIRSVVEKLVQLIGGGQPLWGSVPYRPSESMSLYADIEETRRLLGWEPKVDFDEGLRLTIDYIKMNQ